MSTIRVQFPHQRDDGLLVRISRSHPIVPRANQRMDLQPFAGAKGLIGGHPCAEEAAPCAEPLRRYSKVSLPCTETPSPSHSATARPPVDEPTSDSSLGHLGGPGIDRAAALYPAVVDRISGTSVPVGLHNFQRPSTSSSPIRACPSAFESDSLCDSDDSHATPMRAAALECEPKLAP